MKFGKLFTKLIQQYPEFATLSANRCSSLTYKELKSIAKKLYPTNKELLIEYMRKSREDLAANIYKALKTL